MSAGRQRVGQEARASVPSRVLRRRASGRCSIVPFLTQEIMGFRPALHSRRDSAHDAAMLLFDWHDPKSDRTLAERGFDFGYASRIWQGPVLEAVDERRDDGERRVKANRRIDGRCFSVVSRCGKGCTGSSRRDGHCPWNASSGRFWWHRCRHHQGDEVLHDGENPDAQQHETTSHHADAPADLFHQAPPLRRHRSAAEAHGLPPGSAMKRAAIEAGDHRANCAAAEGAAGR